VPKWLDNSGSANVFAVATILFALLAAVGAR
jgi:hypothetical protein